MIGARVAAELEKERNVRVLERFTFVEVPAEEAERVARLLSDSDVRGHPLRAQPARR